MAENKKTNKEFGLSSASINSSVTVLVLTAIIFLAGYLSFTSMPKENFPEINVPEIYVSTPYPGNSPLDIEKLITRPLEKEINTITGVEEITSTSVQGYSSIRVEFDFSVTSDEALRKVKDKVDIAKGDADFPQDLPADPSVFAMNFSELVPILNINLSGEFSLDQLKEYGEYLEEKIEQISEISDVEIRGVMDKEVRIDVDLPKMESLEISFNDIAGAIANENMTISGGELLVDNYRRSIRVVGEFNSFKEIENVIIKQDNNNIVYLRDLATVSFQEEEKESYAREYRSPVVMLDVMKRGGENLISASAAIDKIIEEAQENYLPDNLQISITGDQSDMTETQIDELINSILFGVILVVLVLLFFLGLRNALFVGVAIPLSMLLSFFILASAGVTLNVMVLFSLVLALGMLVDNGIVVVENIYRLMDEGMDPISAAKYGVGEVAWPIIASTATTLAAFIPLALWPGLMGEFMKYLPITLIIVLSSSLFVALVINPVLTSRYMRVGDVEVNKKRWTRISLILAGVGLLLDIALGVNILGNLLLITGLVILLNLYVLTPGSERFQEKVIPFLESKYEGLLRRLLKGSRPIFLFIGMIGLLFFSFFLMQVFPPQVTFFPDNQPQYLNVYMEMPIGTDIEATNEITKQVEDIVIAELKKKAKIGDSDVFVDGEAIDKEFIVNSIIAQVGEGTSDPAQGPTFGQTPHKARIAISFVKFAEREGIDTNDILTDVRNAIKGFPGVQIVVSKNADGPPQGAPINIEVSGDDYAEILQSADSLKQYLDAANVEGVEELKLDVQQGKSELIVNIDRDKARRLNVSTAQIGDVMRTALFGKEISTYKEGEDDYPINLRYDKKYAYDLDAMMDQKITFRNNQGRIVQIPISAIATIERSTTFNAVKRMDLDRVITISSNVLDGYNANEIVEILKSRLESFKMPDGITANFTGQQEEQAKEMAFLSTALMIAVFLIFLIIVAQFNSTSTPVIILMAVVLSLIGVLLGLIIFQMEFVIIMTMIGIISLAGVVVNNAIVLIDYTNLIKERKKEELGLSAKEKLSAGQMLECIIEGGKKRLRPVLLTAITTVLGLVPLAVGLNIDFYGLVSKLDPNIYMGGDNVVFWGPMSWTIIFGLTFATFLTLVVVPVMYLLIDRIKSRRARS